MGLPSTFALPALAALLVGSAATTLHQGVPRAIVQDRAMVQNKAAATVQEPVTWRTDLAAAMAEARRTKRPLLAVFR